MQMMEKKNIEKRILHWLNYLVVVAIHAVELIDVGKEYCIEHAENIVSGAKLEHLISLIIF